MGVPLGWNLDSNKGGAFEEEILLGGDFMEVGGVFEEEILVSEDWFLFLAK